MKWVFDGIECSAELPTMGVAFNIRPRDEKALAEAFVGHPGQRTFVAAWPSDGDVDSDEAKQDAIRALNAWYLSVLQAIDSQAVLPTIELCQALREQLEEKTLGPAAG